MIDYIRHSPHQDQRPNDSQIKLLVIHNIALPPNSYSGPWIDDLFMGRLDSDAHPYFKPLKDLKVSAHLLILRTGICIQYVPFDKRAWHAGDSSWQGEARCNDFSIGIELEGSDDVPYQNIQYEKLAKVIKLLADEYPLLAKNNQLKRHICGHSDIAPGRKTDPGLAFNWQSLYLLLD